MNQGTRRAVSGEDRDGNTEVIWRSVESDQPPRVGVAISLHNYEEYIGKCLDSVAQQTVESLDLVVVDDCSQDSSVEITQKWLNSNAGRFRASTFLRHAANQGLAAARNDGIQAADTEYLFILDADNLLFPRCLEVLASALDNCSASFAYCYLEKFGEVTELQNTHVWNPDTLYRGNTIDAMVMHKRSLLIAAGGYSSDMPAMGWEDYELWFKIAEAGGWGILVPEILARYRVHSTSMLHQTTNPNAYALTQYLRHRHPTFFPS